MSRCLPRVSTWSLRRIRILLADHPPRSQMLCSSLRVMISLGKRRLLREVGNSSFWKFCRLGKRGYFLHCDCIKTTCMKVTRSRSVRAIVIRSSSRQTVSYAHQRMDGHSKKLSTPQISKSYPTCHEKKKCQTILHLIQSNAVR